MIKTKFGVKKVAKKFEGVGGKDNFSVRMSHTVFSFRLITIEVLARLRGTSASSLAVFH